MQDFAELRHHQGWSVKAWIKVLKNQLRASIETNQSISLLASNNEHFAEKSSKSSPPSLPSPVTSKYSISHLVTYLLSFCENDKETND